MIHFVGAGSGAPDLITIRGKNYLEQADVIIYAGSLVNPALLECAKPGCEIFNSATMTLEEVIAQMERAEKEHRMTVRLHTGDPCLYGAIREQMDRLKELKIDFDVCPGVSSFCGAAAALEAESGLPVVLWDERRTSVDAHRILHANGKKMKKHKQTVDAVAASLILEGFLASPLNA